jgi:hypothetical protein
MVEQNRAEIEAVAAVLLGRRHLVRKEVEDIIHAVRSEQLRAAMPASPPRKSGGGA